MSSTPPKPANPQAAPTHWRARLPSALRRRRAATIAMLVVLMLVVLAVGRDWLTTATTPVVDKVAVGKDCGLGNGQNATGEPIKIGGIFGITGGADLFSAGEAAKAYFDCVNANGGIRGRPIEYLIEDDKWNPEAAILAATKLISDGVVALAANASLVEMSVNAATYEAANLISIAASCGVRACYETKNIVATNAGPLGSNLGMLQWAAENLGTKHVACIAMNIPTNGRWVCETLKQYMQEKGGRVSAIYLNPTKPEFYWSILEADATGADTILTALPSGLAIHLFKAAQEFDLRERYHWIAPSSLYNQQLPNELGDYWDGVIYLHLQSAPVDSTGKDATRWRNVMAAYAAPTAARDSASQTGFVSANVIVDTLLQMNPAHITRANVTEALRQVSGYQTDLLCSPFYVGPGDRHFPIHSGQIAQMKNGGFTIISECFDTFSSYFDDVIAVEKQLGLR